MTPPPAAAQPFDGAAKVALLLLLLDEPEAAALLGRLSPSEVEAVGHAMARVSEASPHRIDALLDEVLAHAEEIVALDAGPPAVRTMLGSALGGERAIGMIDRMGPSVRQPLFASLAWIEPPAIAALLAGEHPQAQALVIAHLPGERAAQVLARLPEASRLDLVRRVATLAPMAPDVLERFDAAFARRLSATPPRPPLGDLGGMLKAASLINLAGLDEDEALATLGAVDPDAAAILADSLFTFADLARLDDRALQGLMRTLDADLLIPALRGAPAELRSKLLGAMPQRAAEALADEIGNRGPVRMDEAETAQKSIAAAARRMASEGLLSLPGKGPAYV